MSIRTAGKSDCTTIATIYNQFLGKSTMDLEVKNPNYFEHLLLHQNQKEGLYVIEDQSLIKGWGILKRYSDREGYAKAAETSVYIDSDHTGLGYGRSMKTHLISSAKEKGYKHLVAKIWANNEVSIQYNLRFGYTIVGTQKQIGYVKGKYIDVVIMQYVFPD